MIHPSGIYGGPESRKASVRLQKPVKCHQQSKTHGNTKDSGVFSVHAWKLKVTAIIPPHPGLLSHTIPDNCWQRLNSITCIDSPQHKYRGSLNYRQYRIKRLYAHYTYISNSRNSVRSKDVRGILVIFQVVALKQWACELKPPCWRPAKWSKSNQNYFKTDRPSPNYHLLTRTSLVDDMSL